MSIASPAPISGPPASFGLFTSIIFSWEAGPPISATPLPRYSFGSARRPPSALLLLALEDLPRAAAVRTGRPDLDGPDPAFRLRTGEVDVQQPVVEPRALHLDALCEHEGPLELPRRDPTMQKHPPLRVIGLPSADHELVVLL